VSHDTAEANKEQHTHSDSFSTHDLQQLCLSENLHPHVQNSFEPFLLAVEANKEQQTQLPTYLSTWYYFHETTMFFLHLKQDPTTFSLRICHIST
jgi:hypothetical protein